jgi:hypothetical protein
LIREKTIKIVKNNKDKLSKISIEYYNFSLFIQGKNKEVIISELKKWLSLAISLIENGNKIFIYEWNP